MLTDDGADHVDRIDVVGRRGLPDLRAQPVVGRQEVAHLLVFQVEGGLAGLGAPNRSPGDRRLLGMAVALGHDTERSCVHTCRRKNKQRQEECPSKSTHDTFTPSFQNADCFPAPPIQKQGRVCRPCPASHLRHSFDGAA
ncbi:hypothetical protein [Hydrogenophaga sp. NH-16]|uniref:hypothetical protein n=1 Tax=Hydrogenophaga sp. NH-16 TaxID=2184519 RepID=UPI0019D47FA6|nr:hypothetical protein [Hydrogenophaga sp. NH-16]